MRFLDTHCHLDQIMEKLGETDFSTLRATHFTNDFAGCLTISCDPEAIEPTLALMHNDGVFGSFGIHPHDAAKYTPEIEAAIAAALQHPKCLAYGEIGLDYHYDFSPRGAQRDIFIHQLAIAIAAHKPIVIHTREADDDTLAVMRDHVPRDWPVHVHCFTSSRALAQSLLEDFSNLYIGFTGILTFKNADDVRETARIVPLHRVLVETDGPYLAPAPHRGRPAHPGHIPLIVNKLAEVRGESVATVATATFDNAKRLYGF